jgi:hypothetical protein
MIAAPNIATSLGTAAATPEAGNAITASVVAPLRADLPQRRRAAA